MVVLYGGCFDLFCSGWVCVCVCVCGGGVFYCVGVLVICVLTFTAFCIVCTVIFVLFRLCIFILICFACTGVRTAARE
jgi:hypothetical protein